jgi:DNA-binding NarL/FixJ family response regulator
VLRNTPRLTEKDLAILDALADGVNPSELNQQFGVTLSTIKARIKRLKSRLGISDCRPSIALAIWWAKVPEIYRLDATEVPIKELRSYYQQGIES